MSGLIILFILGWWGTASFFLARFIVKPIKHTEMKVGVNIVLAAFLFIVPVLDDIIGGFQFRGICHQNANVVIDEDKARGKTVVYQNATAEKIKNSIVPIRQKSFTFKDKGSNELLISWVELDADGGWLSRLLNVSSTTYPYTFNGSCQPENSGGSLFKKLNITVTYKE